MSERHLGDFGIVARQRFHPIGAVSVLWEVGVVHQFNSEPAPHARLYRAGLPCDMKTIAREILHEDRFFEPANWSCLGPSFGSAAGTFTFSAF